MTDIPLRSQEAVRVTVQGLLFLALQFSPSRGSGNGGPLVQVSGLEPNERHLSVIKVPVLEH